MPNLIPSWEPWMRPAGRLTWAIVLLFIGISVTFLLLKRPKPNRPATWAECIAGAVGVFAMMTLAYAVIPSEWITFSDKYLQWNTTRFVVRSGQDFGLFKFPFDINQQAVRDVVAATIYIVFFGLNLFLFSKWQARGKVDDVATETPKVSRFGRPLRRGRSNEPEVTAPVTDALQPEPAGPNPVGVA
ncbi:MAG: hypothetical protein ACHQDE_01850 [Acidimicrobiia bacterium]